MVDVANARDEAVADEATQISLDAAAEQDEVQVPADGKELTPEQKEQQERSYLGRKGAKRLEKLEQELVDSRKQFNEFLGRFEDYISRASKPQVMAPPPPPVDDDPDRPLTKREIAQLLAERETARTQQQSEYQAEYRNTLNSMKRSNGDLHDEIVAEMMQNFNVIVTGNPKVDAEFNMSKAAASVMRKKMAGPNRKAPLGGGEAIATGLSGTTRAKASEPAEVKLDPETEEIMRYLSSKGKDRKWAAEALKGEVPLNLMGKR